jgi:GT2 family glycosyltransferase
MHFLNGVNPVHFARGVHPASYEANLRGAWPCVTGACMMVRRQVWNTVGGLAEAYEGFGFEDVDFCLTAREAGFLVWYEPSARATHEESATSFNSGPRYREARRQADVVTAEIFRRRWAVRYTDLNVMRGSQRTHDGE